MLIFVAQKIVWDIFFLFKIEVRAIEIEDECIVFDGC